MPFKFYQLYCKELSLYRVGKSWRHVMEWSIFPALSGFWLIWWYYFPFCVVLETLRNLKLKLWTKHCPHTVLSPLFQMNKCRRCRDGDVTHLHAYTHTHTHVLTHGPRCVDKALDWSSQPTVITYKSTFSFKAPPPTHDPVWHHHGPRCTCGWEQWVMRPLSLPPGTSCKIISFSQNKEERF